MKTNRLRMLAVAASCLLFNQSAQSEPGALREVWTNVSGYYVSELRELAAYPSEPVVTDIIESLQTPVNWHNYYGQRLRALVKPQTSGDYTFKISGDDTAELWFSSDELPENATRIARVKSWTASEEWDKHDDQSSEPINLVAGRSYYIEVLHKEHSGGDSVAVAWALGSGPLEILDATVLSTVDGAVTPSASNLWVEAGPNAESYEPALGLALNGQVLDETDLRGSYTAQWAVTSGAGVIIDQPDQLDAQATFPGAGTYTLTLTVTQQGITETDSLTVTVHPRLDPQSGKALQQFWFGIRGDALDTLTSHHDFPLHPHMNREVAALDGPYNFSSYYGTRTIGYLLPPTTGDYRFYLSGDDNAEFALSTDASAGNMRVIAEVESSTSPGDFSVNPTTQRSETIRLTKGQRYYFELLHKEHGSSDHHTVYWGREGDGRVQVITGEFLAPAQVLDGSIPTADFDVDYLVFAGKDQTLYAPDFTAQLDGYAIKQRGNAEVQSQSWSVVGTGAGVSFADPTDPETSVRFPDEGTYTLRLQVVTDQQTIHDDVRVVVRPALSDDTGLLTREVWFNKTFNTLDEVRAWKDYPDAPQIVDSIPSLRGPTNWSSKYATRVTGWLYAPSTGNYTFYITGDDEAEFRISSDETAGNLALACRVSSPTRSTHWFDYPEQKSHKIALRAGQRYYVELLHRETWGSDHFQVAWSVGANREPELIQRSYFAPAKPAPLYREEVSHYAYAGADRVYYWPHDDTILSGTIQKIRSSDAEVATSWAQVSGPDVRLNDLGSSEASVHFPEQGRYVFRFTATGDGVVHSDEITITLLPRLADDTGSILRSVWLDVGGYAIEDLLEIDPNLAYPDFEDLLPGTETPRDWAHYYGTRLAGYLDVPTAGTYTFWISANDRAELWLGSSGDAHSAEKIAFLNSAVSPGQWTRREGQESVPITLAQGRYYIEARHKEYRSSDHLAVAWSGPATNGRELISKGFLAPLHDAPKHESEIQVVLGQDRVLLWPNDTLRLTGLVYDLHQGPEALTYKWGHIGVSGGVVFSDPNYPATDMKFAGPGLYLITLNASDGAHSSTDLMIVTVQDPLEPSTGSILLETYTDISGYRVSDLTEASSFPDEPTFRDTVSRFETPVTWADNYGTRLRGYLRVPESADYTFYISSDDASELWLNVSGSDTDGKELVAHTSRETGRYRWNRYESQISVPIRLEPGVRYYIEALHKEGTHKDYLSVGWAQSTDPSGSIQVIQGAMLIPYEEADTIDEAITINAGEDVSVRWPFETLQLKGTAYDLTNGPQPLEVFWDVTRGSAGVEIAGPNTLQTDVRFPGPGKYSLQLTATDGLNTRTDELVVRILSPLAEDTGSLLCEIYEDIRGYRVVDLLSAESFPNAPSARTQLKSLETPANLSDAYGARIRGYLHPHISGVHRFNLSGDDWAELYLSTDESPERKELICFTPQAVSQYDWLKYPEYQVSRPIVLKKGQKYYLEARLKDQGSRDHLAVAWHTPRTDRYEIIPGANLSPLLPLTDATAPTIRVQGASEMVLTVDSEFIDPGIVADDDIDGNLTGLVLVDHNIDTSTPGDYAVRYRVFDAAGNESDEVVRKVSVVLANSRPAFYPVDGSGNHAQAPWSEPADITDLEASRFLLQASFGPSEEAIAEVKRLGFEGWIDQQLTMTPSSHLAELDRYARFKGARGDTTYSGMSLEMSGTSGELPMASSRVHDRIYVWWTHAIKAPDQLRQRMAFALSEILVISDRESELSRYPRGTTHYYDLLVNHSFGNYRDLLYDISVNPMMGIWLTHVRTSKDSPDENYPRELLQLFSIGLSHLNQDGTLKRGPGGEVLPTYDQDVVLDLSRALTGWTYSGSQDFYQTPATGVDSINPLIPFEEQHDRGAKTLLGGHGLPSGQTASQDLESVIDNVFGHPNVAPFICRRLIQRMVTSNPSPAYLYRVSGVFNDNGDGVRGDLGAVVKAILLDPEAREMSTSDGAGKVREPLLRLSNLMRGCYREPSSNPPTLGRFVFPDTTKQYGQSPLGAQTVFNFFEPDYSLSGPLMEAGLFAPEFQIVTELVAVDMANHLYDGIRSGFYVDSSHVQRLGVNLSKLEALVGNPDDLLNRLEKVLVGRRLASETRAHIKAAIAPYADDPTDTAKTVLQVLVASPEFAIQR